MPVAVEPEPPEVTWRPRATRALGAAIDAADRVFDRVYSSAYNPLHRTGTLAALCLLIAVVTGVYLLFVYEIGRPYESMAKIQGDPLLGRPIRALHRYASDLAVIALVLHVLRLVVQGKTWGPRALAWISGVVLAGAMFLSAMTGFVLVWDRFAQKVAVAGARMLRLLPLFPEPPDRAFTGDLPIASQFFFMNLFLHVAIPLGMICFLWLHTLRLARAAWFPERKVALSILASLVLLAVLWPAPLPPAADLLSIPGRVATDWFYGFWVPLAERSPPAVLGIAVVLGGAVLTAPLWLRPRTHARPLPAVADPERCEGCQQCFQDCPYDAIQMVPGKYPEAHPLRAEVQASLCVSCGVCAGSCASLAIGPPLRTAREQLASARELVATTPDPGRKTLLVACLNNGGIAARLDRWAAGDPSRACFAVDCTGTLHPATVAYLASRFAGVRVIACPPHNCRHREGAALADARLIGGQRPAVPGRISPESVRVLHLSSGEWPDVLAAIAGPPAAAATRSTALRRYARTIACTAAMLAVVALGSRGPQGADPEHAVLRLGWRFAGQVKERCRELTAEELAKRPVHMRSPRECVREVLPYDLSAVVDGRVVVDKRVTSPGFRADRPLSVEEDVDVPAGPRAVLVTFRPTDPGAGGRELRFEGTVRFERGRVVLLTFQGNRLVPR